MICAKRKLSLHLVIEGERAWKRNSSRRRLFVCFLLVSSLFENDGQWDLKPRASAEKFPGEGQRKKRPKNSTIKLLSTISVACMKIQGGGARPPCPPLPTPMSETTALGNFVQKQYI